MWLKNMPNGDFISRTLERTSDYSEKCYCITNVGNIYTACVNEESGVGQSVY
jgi:hypothetical protein